MKLLFAPEQSSSFTCPSASNLGYLRPNVPFRSDLVCRSDGLPTLLTTLTYATSTSSTTSITMFNLRIAVIINTDDPEPLRMMEESFISIFNTLAAGSTVEFFHGFSNSPLPSVADGRYDLLVIGGGTYIPSSDSLWVHRLLEFERDLYTNYPCQKTVCICIGHQTMAIALGGSLEYMPEPEVSCCWLLDQHYLSECILLCGRSSILTLISSE